MAKALKQKRLNYTGNVQPQLGERDPKTGQLLYPYLPSEELVEAVNLAIFLERPLLIKGEPGCGKTRLARAVAYELNLPYEAWHIKSISRAKDGLYRYDAVGRLRDAQLAATGRLSDDKIQEIDQPHIKGVTIFVQYKSAIALLHEPCPQNFPPRRIPQ